MIDAGGIDGYKDENEQITDIVNKSIALTEKALILREDLIKRYGGKSTKTNRRRNPSESKLLTEGKES